MTNHSIYLVVATLLSISTSAMAQEAGQEGIVFIDNEWNDALATAKASGKNIFIDAYTTWCGPCKMMDRDVFTDSSVAIFYNKHFINLKLDIEKGDGLEVAEKFQVRAYPSFLFIDADQNLVHRGVGYQPVARFLQLGDEALDPAKQIGVLARAYRRGERSPELQYNYALALLKAGDQQGIEVGQEYLETQENWAESDNMELVFRMAHEYDDPYYNFIVVKKHLFIKQFGEGWVNNLLRSLLERHLYQQIDQVDLKETKEEYARTFTASKALPFYDLFEVNYYDLIGKKEAYIKAARAYVKKYSNLSWSTLNQLAWNFYEKVDDVKALKWATKVAKKSIAIDSNHFNNDTLAALYFKQGKKKNALKYAERAIEIAKNAGAPFEETKALMEKIETL